MNHDGIMTVLWSSVEFCSLHLFAASQSVFMDYYIMTSCRSMRYVSLEAKPGNRTGVQLTTISSQYLVISTTMEIISAIDGWR